MPRFCQFTERGVQILQILVGGGGDQILLMKIKKPPPPVKISELSPKYKTIMTVQQRLVH